MYCAEVPQVLLLTMSPVCSLVCSVSNSWQKGHRRTEATGACCCLSLFYEELDKRVESVERVTCGSEVQNQEVTTPVQGETQESIFCGLSHVHSY